MGKVLVLGVVIVVVGFGFRVFLGVVVVVFVVVVFVVVEEVIEEEFEGYDVGLSEVEIEEL